jgi:hypothetical protein
MEKYIENIFCKVFEQLKVFSIDEINLPLLLFCVAAQP